MYETDAKMELERTVSKIGSFELKKKDDSENES